MSQPRRAPAAWSELDAALQAASKQGIDVPCSGRDDVVGDEVDERLTVICSGCPLAVFIACERFGETSTAGGLFAGRIRKVRAPRGGG